MSGSTSGRGIANDDFEDDEIEWDEEDAKGDAGDGDTDGLSPIEELVAETEDFVNPDDQEIDEEADDDDDIAAADAAADDAES